MSENTDLPTLVVSPLSGLADEVVSIKVTGLKSEQPVTFESRSWNKSGRLFVAYGHYTSNSDGCIDLEKDASLGGDYVGKDPMALFWAARLNASARPGSSVFALTEATKPFEVQINVHRGHLTEEDALKSAPFLTTTVQRCFMNDRIKRIPVRTGRVRATLFMPTTPGPHPGVIEMEGGGAISPQVEWRAALLACHGFAVLSLPYFGRHDLPRTLERIEIEYFEEAVDFLKNHRDISKCGIGAVGYSLGGCIALAISAFIPEIRCVTSIAGPFVAFFAPITYRGKVWPKLERGHTGSKIRYEGGTRNIRDGLPTIRYEDMPKCFPPFHKSEAALLIISCGDDMIFRTEEYAALLPELMRSANKTNYKLISYPGAGHSLHPPYFPLTRLLYTRKDHEMPTDFGGKPRLHAEAQVKYWKELQEFLENNLRRTSAL